MLNTKTLLALGGALALAACAAPPPTTPTVLSTPPEGKELAKFQNEDMNCRQYAMNQGAGTAQQGTNASVGSAAVGTVVGAAAGALLGAAGGNAGGGAAVGAGLGLLTGSAVGANQARDAGYSAQQIFDMAYSQCMTASGNQIQGPVAPAYGRAAYPYYGAPYPYYPGYYPAPAVVVAPGWGWGWGGGWRGGWGRRW